MKLYILGPIYAGYFPPSEPLQGWFAVYGRPTGTYIRVWRLCLCWRNECEARFWTVCFPGGSLSVRIIMSAKFWFGLNCVAAYLWVIVAIESIARGPIWFLPTAVFGELVAVLSARAWASKLKE